MQDDDWWEWHMSKAGRIAAAFVVLATIGCEIPAIVVYRNDWLLSDLPVLIIICGLLALGIVCLMDWLVRGFWQRIHRSRS